MKQFKGSTPRIAEHLLDQQNAAVAIDCRFWHGDLQSWYEPKKSDDLHQEAGYKYELLGCCWVKLPICASVAGGGVNCVNKYYVTGRIEYPEVAVVDPATCAITWHRLGLPCPYKAPSIYVLNRTEHTKDVEARTYIYQWVNSLGEKSAGSPPSNPIELIDDGTPVVVSGWEVPDASWDVTKVRIYRSVSGLESGKEGTNTFATVYMLVGEADINAPSFTDSKINYELSEALGEDIVMAPPADLQGITEVDSQNTLAG